MLTCSRKGPNSSPIQKLPSSARTSDSMSKSAPVSSRSFVAPFTIGKWDLVVGVAQADEALELDRAVAAAAVSQRGLAR